jgi:hypothetical protein
MARGHRAVRVLDVASTKQDIGIRPDRAIVLLQFEPCQYVALTLEIASGVMSLAKLRK